MNTWTVKYYVNEAEVQIEVTASENSALLRAQARSAERQNDASSNQP